MGKVTGFLEVDRLDMIAAVRPGRNKAFSHGFA